MPSSLTVCSLFDEQRGTAGYNTSLGLNLFSKTVNEGPHLLTKLSRVRVSHPSVVTNHSTHRSSKLLNENLFITPMYMMPIGIVVSGPIQGRHRVILCPRGTILHL